VNVTTVYVNAYKYDSDFAEVCIASIRYWYPHIPIVLIKDTGAGNFDTRPTEENWDIQVFDSPRKRFGWGFGKWEPLFIDQIHSFLVLDADTVLTGPILDAARGVSSQFIVHEEVQPMRRLNEIYYKLDRIKEVNAAFVYPGYTFNEGQWFGTSGVLTREDFAPILEWTEPPTSKFPQILLQGAQGHFNFTLQLKQQLGSVSLTRKKIMIFPEGNNADFLDLEKIKRKVPDYPFVLHWAGYRFRTIEELPRGDILAFYRDYYFSKLGKAYARRASIRRRYLYYEERFLHCSRRLRSLLKQSRTCNKP
jgi:hypothetical protein